MSIKLNLILLLLLFFVPFIGEAQKADIQSFPLSSVELLNSPFKKAEQTDLQYMLALQPDKLLAPYLREAGLQPKAETYGNWEGTGLDGHIGGHYLSALAMMWASTGNEELLDRLNYMIVELKRAQNANGNGYLGGVPGSKALWEEIGRGTIKADNFSLNGKWVPWYNIHKIYAGLRDAYQYAGNETAKEMLIKLSDWSLQLVSGLSDAQIQQMLNTEHGGMNEIFADVAAITGDQKYMELARKFSHQVVLDPLKEQQDRLNGMHANTQIPKVIGFKRVADVAGDNEWDRAAEFFWQTVVENRSVAIGGNSVREHFHPASDFTPMITDREGPETCNTYNMLRLSKMLYESSTSLEFLEYYERGLYNHILSSQHPEKGGFVYFTPMRPNHYRVYSQPDEAFWCCVGSGLENHAKYGELIYAHNGNDLFVNLFIPSRLDWQEKKLSVTQQTNFPEEDKTILILNEAPKGKFAMHIRYPSWVAPGAMTVKVNGKEQQISSQPGSYVPLNRKWKKGDKVEVALPMQTKLEQLPDGSPYFAVVHGPLVLAAKTTTANLEGLFADDSRMGHIAHGELYPLQDAPMFVSADQNILAKIEPVKNKALTFRAPELIYPDTYDQLELIPFYKVHDARYVVYWQHATPQQVDSLHHLTQEREEAERALATQTIDQVAPGEQQPEADHFFKADNTESGVYKGRHWRQASGWFSYELKNPKKEVAFLRVTYYGGDSNRNFDILINDQKIATAVLDGSQSDQFYTVDYPIPSAIVQNAPDGKLVTKFQAHPDSVSGRIYHVRLMRTKDSDLSK